MTATPLDLYRDMLRVRVVEEVIAARYGEQEMRCPVHLCIGQEAVAAGVCRAMARRDHVLSGHRSHGHYLAKGGDLKAMMAEIYGKAAGCAKGKGGSMHLVDMEVGFLGATPIVGSTIPIGVGSAFGSWQRGEDRVTAVFFGDGATEAGVLHESLNFAVLKNLPVIFVCENNLYSVYSPLEVRQPDGRSIAQMARGHNIETQVGDGNDVLAVHALAVEAVDRARRGEGPTFLEFATYRWLEHCGPNLDNHVGYRTEAEYEDWKARCPIENLAARLVRDGVCFASEVESLAEELRREAEDAVAYAKSLPFPDPSEMMAEVYAS